MFRRIRTLDQEFLPERDSTDNTDLRERLEGYGNTAVTPLDFEISSLGLLARSDIALLEVLPDPDDEELQS